jgi:hypothetical protein
VPRRIRSSRWAIVTPLWLLAGCYDFDEFARRRAAAGGVDCDRPPDLAGNLLSENQALFEASGAWYLSSATQLTAPGSCFGGAAVRVCSGSGVTYFTLSLDQTLAPLIEGRHAARVWVRTEPTGYTLTLDLRLYDGSQMLASGSAQSQPNGDWQRIEAKANPSAPSNRFIVGLTMRAAPLRMLVAGEACFEIARAWLGEVAP